MVETHCPLFPLVSAKPEFGGFLFLEQPPGMPTCLLEFYPLQRYTLPFPNSRLMLFSLNLSLVFRDRVFLCSLGCLGSHSVMT